MSRFHRGSCRKKMSNICNCIVDDNDGVEFFQCCGWYHKGCKGRIVDDRKRKKWERLTQDSNLERLV